MFANSDILIRPEDPWVGCLLAALSLGVGGLCVHAIKAGLCLFMSTFFLTSLLNSKSKVQNALESKIV